MKEIIGAEAAEIRTLGGGVVVELKKRTILARNGGQDQTRRGIKQMGTRRPEGRRTRARHAGRRQV